MNSRFKLICLAAVVLTISIFSPLLISSDHRPEVMGLPYTIWVGFLYSIAYSVLIGLGIRSLNKKEEQQ